MKQYAVSTVVLPKVKKIKTYASRYRVIHFIKLIADFYGGDTPLLIANANGLPIGKVVSMSYSINTDTLQLNTNLE